MRRNPTPLLGLLLAAACNSAPVPDTLATRLAEVPHGQPCRLWLEGNRVTAAAVPVVRALPQPVRVAVEAMAPGAEVVWQGHEWGPRGEGFRVDSQSRIDGAQHFRTALFAADGRVLERAHEVPLRQVPADVLVAAMQAGPEVQQALIVSGPEREEHWRCTVRDRQGRTFVATVSLDGRLQAVQRRLAADLDV